MAADLHIHSSASDGSCTPEQIVDMARSLGIRTISIADHDSVEGVERALDYGLRKQIEVIPSVELSSESEMGDFHFIGYFVDHKNISLQRHLAELREKRLVRAGKIVDKLTDFSIDLDFDQILADSQGGSVGRVHLARELIRKGYAQSVGDAFARYLSKESRFYVPKFLSEPEEVISILIRANSVPVLAHPGLLGSEDKIRFLAEKGVRGIEVYYPKHDPWLTSRYAQIAEELGLVKTGGSDFHGPGSQDNESLGSVLISDQLVEELRQEHKRLSKLLLHHYYG
ncbi:3',5'-nucleoside bisphosphate phosphatase [Candidatus Hakubella thermalkaliphila]|uniref:3',5'-nucleoside bisphosphate phosphatase n=1 Tax=Candidatus Hakubella thermalkaliphila TaxID=2754717 RepID=A0A6V8NLB6_9ACTN|nr:PHP domain-containing protein [Candidatus Hakubella thermalkaliphila]MBT9170717.1 5'-3' exoribonuclease [Actinomycetota bacterium]GFP21072.1 3',5'-nucleoside bisphosphate phosphatase [Candidatus Hakubella thermalkaliphila]